MDNPSMEIECKLKKILIFITMLGTGFLSLTQELAALEEEPSRHLKHACKEFEKDQLTPITSVGEARKDLRLKIAKFSYRESIQRQIALYPYLAFSENIQGDPASLSTDFTKDSSCNFMKEAFSSGEFVQELKELELLSKSLKGHGRNLFAGKLDSKTAGNHNNGLYGQILEASLEVEFAKAFTSLPYWWKQLSPKNLKRPRGKKVDQLLVQFANSTNLKSGTNDAFDYIASRLNWFPILNFESEESLGFVKKSVSQAIVEKYLQERVESYNPKKPLKWNLLVLLRDKINKTYAKLSGRGLDQDSFAAEALLSPLEGLSLDRNQRSFFIATQMVLLLEFPILKEKFLEEALDDKRVYDYSSKLLARVAEVRIQGHQKFRKNLCSKSHSQVEYHPGLIVNYLRTNKNPEDVKNVLNTYCQINWGVTNRSRFESATYALAGITLAMSAIPQIRTIHKPLAAITASLTAISFLSQLESNESKRHFKKLAFNPSPTELNIMRATSILYGALAPFSASLGFVVASHLSHSKSAAEYFLPIFTGKGQSHRIIMFVTDLSIGQFMYVKKWIERGKNPIKQPIFWVEFVSDYIKTLAMAQMFKNVHFAHWTGEAVHYIQGFAVYETIGFVMDNWVQEVTRTFVGKEKEPRTILFKLWWENSVSFGYKPLQKKGLHFITDSVGKAAIPIPGPLRTVVQKSGIKLLSRTVEHGSVALAPIVETLFGFASVYVYANLKSSAYLRYLEDQDMSYFEAIKSFSIRDLKPQWNLQKATAQDIDLAEKVPLSPEAPEKKREGESTINDREEEEARQNLLNDLKKILSKFH